MEIILSHSSKKPIYEQITEQVKQQILNQILKSGDALPSMRFLAKELHISVITTKRAYEELEKEGFIVTVVGKGSFVASGNVEALKEEHLKQVEESLLKACELGRRCGLSKSEMIELLDVVYEEV